MTDKQVKEKAKGQRKKKEVKLRIKWVKSSIGCSQRQKATIKSLGLKRLGETVEWKDDPATRGMIDKVRHLVEVEEVVVGN
ncbi:MAG: 50S ribosomal protein L30 [Chloroflexi bacterium]|nr:50S ribosomal protein L30 [Chloroflexota bacterium]